MTAAGNAGHPDALAPAIAPGKREHPGRASPSAWAKEPVHSASPAPCPPRPKPPSNPPRRRTPAVGSDRQPGDVVTAARNAALPACAGRPPPQRAISPARPDGPGHLPAQPPRVEQAAGRSSRHPAPPRRAARTVAAAFFLRCAQQKKGTWITPREMQASPNAAGSWGKQHEAQGRKRVAPGTAPPNAQIVLFHLVTANAKCPTSIVK
ncbi:hypothetical protein FQZ97_915790 [compost metagenome]